MVDRYRTYSNTLINPLFFRGKLNISAFNFYVFLTYILPFKLHIIQTYTYLLKVFKVGDVFELKSQISLSQIVDNPFSISIWLDKFIYDLSEK